MAYDDVVLPNMAPGESLGINEALRFLEARVNLLERNTMRIVQDYEHGRCYRAGDVVRVDDSYTMVYIRDSCDSPRIEIAGAFQWLTGETDPPSVLNWIQGGGPSGVRLRANEYRLLDNRSFFIQRARFYVPHNAATQDYTIYHQRLVPQTGDWVTDIISQNIIATNEGSWLSIPYAALWLRDEYHRMGVGTRALTGTTTFNGEWVQINGQGSPSSGQIAFSNQQDRMRFHYTDNQGGNRTAELQAVPVGAAITRGTDEWTVTDRLDGGSYMQFTVTPGGQRGGAGTYTFNFSYGEAELLYHYQVTDLWFANPFILGIFQNDTDPEGENKNQYMVDIEVAEAVVSPDVAVVSLA